MRKIIVFLLAAIMCNYLPAQTLKTVEGRYVYHASRDESPSQAERIAINKAKIVALQEEFGTTVSGASASSLIQKNGMTQSKFIQLSSEGELNGEWVADIEEPKVSTVYSTDGLVVTAIVKGKAQEITGNKIDFKANILRNSPNINNESEEFIGGNDVFVRFISPVDGYLTIYLLDSEEAYCLLPYRNCPEGSFKVEHGKEYYLFSYNKYSETENPDYIEEYSLTCDDNQELNQFYFVFSPHKFTKPVDEYKPDIDGIQFPRTLSFSDFQKWIIRARRNDKDMTVKTKYVTIKPRH